MTSTATAPTEEKSSSFSRFTLRIEERIGTIKSVLLSAALLFAICAPFLVSQFQVFNLTGVLAYGIAALGLNLITGYIGQISLGHNLFFALGAYASALGVIYLGVNLYLSVLLAGVVCFGAGLLAGLPAQRVTGIYVVLVTLALAVAVTPLIKNFDSVTGGAQGLVLDRPESPIAALSTDSWIYYVVLAFALVIFWLVHNLLAGRNGRAVSGIREAHLSSIAMGVNVFRYKVMVFGLGCALGGIGGALLNFNIGYIAPDSFTLNLSISFLAAIVVGGLGTITGAIVAGAFVQYIPSFAAEVSESFSGAIYGIILILCMIAMPKGVVGTIAAWRRRLVDNARAATQPTRAE